MRVRLPVLCPVTQVRQQKQPLDKDAAVTLIDVLLKDAGELMNTGNSSATAPTAQTSGESPAQPPGPKNAFRLQVSGTPRRRRVGGALKVATHTRGRQVRGRRDPGRKETPLTGRARSLDLEAALPLPALGRAEERSGAELGTDLNGPFRAFGTGNDRGVVQPRDLPGHRARLTGCDSRAASAAASAARSAPTRPWTPRRLPEPEAAVVPQPS